MKMFVQISHRVFFRCISCTRTAHFVHSEGTLEFDFSTDLIHLALFDTLVFLLNEYFIELNTANFIILNKFLN